MGENLSKIGIILSKEITRTRKIKISKTGNLVFPFPDLSCKFANLKKNGNFEQKDNYYFFLCFYLVGGLALHQIQTPPQIRLRIFSWEDTENLPN